MVVAATYSVKIKDGMEERIITELHKRGVEHIYAGLGSSLVFTLNFISAEKARSFGQNVKGIRGVIDVNLRGPYVLIDSQSSMHLYK